MGLLFASCSKDVNLSSPTPANNGNQQHAEDALGITIASNQTWVMSKNYSFFNHVDAKQIGAINKNFNAPVLPVTTVTVSNWADFSYARADFYIYNKTKDLEVHLPSAQGLTGASPYAICIPQKNWRWPKERISVVKAYSMFAGFAANSDVNIDWFNYPNTSVLTLEE